MSEKSGVLDAETRRKPRVRPHGRCEVCGRVVQVMRDGTCRNHKPPGHYDWDADWCQGSGYRQARWLEGQLLRHHSGDLWRVIEDRCGTTRWRDYLVLGISGREEGRRMAAHGEYMHRHGWTAVDVWIYAAGTCFTRSGCSLPTAPMSELLSVRRL